MLASNIPAKFNIPFANGAGGSFIRAIPQASQIGINPGFASLTDGFPPLNFTPVASGGVPPFGQDFNGLLNQSTAWDRWLSAGGPILYDATFQAAIGGYPNGAIVGSLIVQGNYWMSTVDNNVTNPDTGGAGWVNPPGMMGTGEWKFRPAAATLPGWIISNGTTIGSGASVATQRANADCAFAFNYLWNTYSNTQCPVSGGRGANAAADFAANKTIGTFNMQGVGIMGVDGMGGTPTGLLAGVPAVNGSATIAGSVLGENLHSLIAAENGPHVHAITDIGHIHSYSLATGTPNYGVSTSTAFNSFTTANTGSSVTGITINSQGSGTAHNTVQRSALVYWYMKL